jgi:peptide/nickel transport system permease protein
MGRSNAAPSLLAPPTEVRFVDATGDFHLRPFVYKISSTLDSQTFQRAYVEDTSERYHLRLFVRGHSYKLLGIIPTDLHLFGVEEGAYVFLAGTDTLGRDVLSRAGDRIHAWFVFRRNIRLLRRCRR